MKITASVINGPSGHEVTVATNGSAKRLAIAPRQEGRGSSVNGGELLLAALATCYCNDVFREATRKDIVVSAVEVEVEAEFNAEGAPATSVRYRVRIAGPGDPSELEELGRHTDSVAEIQETVRRAVPVVLEAIEVGGARVP